MRFLFAAAVLLFALPAAAQGMLTTRPAAFTLDAPVAHTDDSNRGMTYGIGATAVYRGVGLTGGYVAGRDGELISTAGIVLYPIRETETSRPGTLAVGLALSHNSRDDLALIPSLNWGARFPKDGRIVLIPQASASVLIPVGDGIPAGQGFPSLTISASLAIGVGSERARVFVSPTMG
ncbi:MAG TPA: hypothetical protein VK610_05285, partial [Rhodothermales bacterium]|nr:hypothetical protein [Rhodothermales bacterium]